MQKRTAASPGSSAIARRLHGKHGRLLETGWEHFGSRQHHMAGPCTTCEVVPGRKTDTKDCPWIADLLQHGLWRGSFVPPTPMRELRDLTRTRTSLRQDHTAVANRMQKILEEANIKDRIGGHGLARGYPEERFCGRCR